MRLAHRLRETAARVRSERLDRAELAALLLLLLFIAAGPWMSAVPPERVRQAFGGGAVSVAGNTLVCLAAFLIAALTFLSASQLPSARLLAAPLWAAAALVAFGAVQLVPLPERTLEAVAPVNLRIYHETVEILNLFGRTKVPAARISIAPTETVDALLLIGACAALFYSASSLLSTRPRRRLFAAVLFGSSLLQIAVAASDGSSEDRARGPFANPDHFAGYLEIAFALAFGALWAEVLTSRDRAGDAAEKAVRLERRLPALAGRILLWGLLAAGIALTESRGGALAAGATTLVLLALALFHRRSRRRAASTAAAALLLGSLFAAAAVGSGRFVRFLELDPRDAGSSTRTAIWRASIDAWREFPVVGSGLGTYREAFRRVQPEQLAGRVEHAHNDFLQLAVTGGAVGAGLGVCLIAALCVLLIRAWLAQRHREESAVALAGFGALLSLTLHGLIEFSLSIPIIPATLAAALGASWAAGVRR